MLVIGKQLRPCELNELRTSFGNANFFDPHNNQILYSF